MRVLLLWVLNAVALLARDLFAALHSGVELRHRRCWPRSVLGLLNTLVRPILTILLPCRSPC